MIAQGFQNLDKKSKKERMTFRQNKKQCLIYPEDQFKNVWDLFMTVILLITCILTPLEIAFAVETDSILDNPLSFAIDLLFAMDICLIFNTAYYTEDFDLIEDRKKISCSYLKGWFMIDFLAIVPFDLIIRSSQYNGLARIARIGKLQKLFKLTRLLRVLKIVKEKNKLLKQVTQFLNIGLGFERMFFFVMIFLLSMHLAACFWLITASIEAAEQLDQVTDSSA